MGYRKSVLLCACAASALAATGARAQSTTGTAVQADAPAATAAVAPAAAAGADIVVTGTLIRGAAPVGSSIIAVSRQDINEKGFATTEEILKSIPQITNIGPSAVPGANTQNANLDNTRADAINIRGIGPQATLALLDGRRVPPQGLGAQLFDASSIPTIALARVDVVADGASATYGSDAVAGVANFILRKDFQGLEMTGRYGFADNYNNFQAAAIAGHHWNNAALMVAGSVDHNSNLTQGSRASYYRCDETALGYTNSCVSANGAPVTANITSPGNLVFKTGTPLVYGLPGGSGVGVTQAQLVAPNVGSNTQQQDVIPRTTRYSIVASGHVDIDPAFTLWGEGYFYHRHVVAGNGYLTLNTTVPNTNPGFVTVAGQSTTSETVQDALINDAPPATRIGYDQAWQSAIGFDAHVYKDFKATVYYEHNNDKELLNTATINTGLLATALACTTGVCFNPYGSGGSATNLAAVKTFLGTNNLNSVYDSNLVNGKVDGTLVHISGGDVKLAVGGEWHWDKLFNFNYTNASVLSTSLAQFTNTSLTRNSRKVASIFGEVIVPLVGSDNGRAGLRKLSLDGAVRYDHYSDVGGTTNPKLGLVYMPTRDLTLRGSFGTSFRAPTLCDTNPFCTPALLTGTNNNLLTYTSVNPAAGNARANTEVTIGGGGVGVRPETATTYSIGFDYRPEQIRNLQLSLNYFNINYKNVIYTPGNATAVYTSPLYAQFITINPSQAQVAALTALPNFTNFSALAGCSSLTPTNTAAYQCIGAIVNGQRANAGAEKLSGLDLSANYRIDTSVGQIRLGFDATYLFNFDVSVVPGAPFVASVNQLNAADAPLGDPLSFRARGQVGFVSHGFDGNFFVNYSNPYSIVGLVSTTQAERVSGYATVDFTLAYTFDAKSGPLDGLRLSANIFNLFDKSPPLAVVTTTQQYDPANASVIGRQFAFTVTKKF